MPRALIVDDNEENLYFLEQLLTGNGYEVTSSRNGAEAMASALEKPPDLIISDILMPVLDGFSLCRAWKQNTALKHIPFVFYTATYTDQKDEEFALNLGANKFIIKPKDPIEFLGLIEEVLTQHLQGELHAKTDPLPSEAVYLKEYNETLIRKLEDKIEQIDKSNKQLSQQEERLKSTLLEKETLLRELFHRTQNNMQVISSILELQSQYTPNRAIKRVLRDIESRIQALSLVHQQLYKTQNLSRIDLKEYLTELANLVVATYGTSRKKIALVLEIDKEWVLFDIAIPCGIVANELLTNALKYGFPRRRTGEVWVRLHRIASGEIEFEIGDNGVGVPADSDFENKSTLGFRLVKAIVTKQLKGNVRFETDRGFSCRVRFKDSLYHERV